MVRSLTAYDIDTSEYENKSVDSLFDFYSLGNNFRNTDLNAFVGMLDFKRIEEYEKSRKDLYFYFKNKLDLTKFYLPSESLDAEDVPFCLPIISQDSQKTIISGFLGYQRCYKEFFDSHEEYQNSIFLHHNGFYVGLFHNLSKIKIDKLVSNLNNI